MNKILVVFYSRTGFTRRVAEQIAKRLQCDLCELREKRRREGALGYLRSIFEALTRREPELQEPGVDPSRYALVILGTPVWAGRVCSPMRAFLTRHRLGGAEVAVFCTLGGSGAEGVLSALALQAGKTPRAGLALTDSEIDTGATARKLDAFVEALRPGSLA